MQVSKIFVALGSSTFDQLVRHISIGKLKTFQLYDRVKLRFHLTKLNNEALRKSAPRLFARIEEGDDEFATDVAQTILVSHLDLIKDVLNFLEIPHEDGFFAKDLDVSGKLEPGWQSRTFEQFRTQHPEAVLVFYVNHLGHEIAGEEGVFQPAPEQVA